MAGLIDVFKSGFGELLNYQILNKEILNSKNAASKEKLSFLQHICTPLH